jgi:hypothetical protein
MATIEGGKTNNSYIKRLQDALADAKKKAATNPYIPRTTTINKNAGQKNYSGRNIVDKRDKYNYPERPRGGVPKKPEPIYPRMGDKRNSDIAAGGLGNVQDTRARQYQERQKYKWDFMRPSLPYAGSVWEKIKSDWEGPGVVNPPVKSMMENPLTNWDLITRGLQADPLVQSVLIDNGLLPNPLEAYTPTPDVLPPDYAPTPPPEDYYPQMGIYQYPMFQTGGGYGYGGGGGYRYPSGGYSSSARNDINRWYANMVQWNINKPKTRG